jgi:hypothetical protein
MNTNLRGTLRAALRVSLQHWRGLTAVSALPFFVASIVSTIQLWQMRDIYVAGLVANLTPTPATQANVQDLVEGHGFLFLGFFIFTALIMAWHFTRIVHFWKSGKAETFRIMPGELHETAAIVVYALFVGLALFATYFLAVVIVVLAAQALSILGVSVGAIELIDGLVSLAALLALVAVAMRFLIGFPGIAQGGTPRPMRDLWPLAKGATFGLTWRAIVLLLGFVIVSIVLLVTFMLPFLAGSGSEIVNPKTYEIGPEAAQAIAAVLAPAQVVGQLIRAVFLVFFTTFLTLAFSRLTHKPTGLNDK